MTRLFRLRRVGACVAGAAVLSAATLAVTPASAVQAAPSVSIETPTPGRVIAGSVPVEVSSSGTYVDLWADQGGAGQFIGRDENAPFTFELDTTGFADGPLVLRARAFDGTWAVRSRTVIVDNTVPTVVFAHPAPLTHHAGWLNVSAAVADANTRFVDLWVAGAFHSRDWSAPYNFAVDTSGIVDGLVELRLRAHDRAGAVSVVSRYVTVANAAASVAIEAPNPGRHVKGVVGVTTSVTGTSAPVAQTEFLVDGQVVDTFPYLPRVISWDTSSVAEGPVALQLRVVDKAGKTATSPVRVVTVDRTAPTIAFTSPRPGATAAGAVAVEVSVVEANVESVQLYAGTTLVATRTEAPYTFDVDLSGFSGPVLLRAVVVDKAKQRAVAGRVVAAVVVQRPYSVGSPTAVRGGDTVTVSWSRPRFDVARPVAGYTIYRYDAAALQGGSSAADLTPFVIGVAAAAATAFVDSEPAPTPVVYAVQAYNSAGVAHPVPVTYSPETAPGAPTITGVTPGDGTLSAMFAAPEADGGSPVVNYEYSLDGGVTWTPRTPASTLSPVSITGLTNGVVYQLSLRAVNGVGPGASSLVQHASPSAPLSLSYPPAPFVFGGPPQSMMPTVAGGVGEASYSYVGSLPAGVSFDPSTGAFLGPSTWDFVAVDVTAGNTHTCALTLAKTVKCWGDNTHGQLGNGTVVDSLAPVDVLGSDGPSTLGDVVAVASGLTGTCALHSDSTVSCWGSDEALFASPVLTSTGTPLGGVAQVSVGGYHACAVHLDSTVSCWGGNDAGQLGNGSWAASASPVRPWSSPVDSAPLSEVVQVSAGDSHTCAVHLDSTVSCWGGNGYGQLGRGGPANGTDRNTPARVLAPEGLEPLSGVVEVAGSNLHVCARTTAGRLFCWGSNWFGGLGDGSTSDRSRPVPVRTSWVDAAPIEGVVAFAVNGSNTCARVDSGALACWGDAFFGQLGEVQGGSAQSRSPVVLPWGAVGPALLEAPFAVGGGHICASSPQGGLSCWGGNDTGQLGIDPEVAFFQTSPVAVTGFTGLDGWPASVTVTASDSTNSAQAVVQIQGEHLPPPPLRPPTVLSATAGQGSAVVELLPPVLRRGEAVLRYEYSLDVGVTWVPVATSWTFTVEGLVNGDEYSLIVRAVGPSGPGVPSPPASLTPAWEALVFSYGSSSFSPAESGQVWSPVLTGGSGSYTFAFEGDLPPGVSFNPSTGAFTGPQVWPAGASHVAAGSGFTCVVTLAGSASCWGDNFYGQLGDGTTTPRHAPSPVTGLESGATAVEAAWLHACAIHNGAVKCWGDNTYGQLGDGTRTSSTTPVQVVGLTSGVTAISTSDSRTCAVHFGAVKCWGTDDQQVGLGDGTSVYERLTPVQVVGLTSGVSDVSVGPQGACALQGGVVKCWGTWQVLGPGAEGGSGSFDNATSPVRVHLPAEVVDVDMGTSEACAATVDGEVYCWGFVPYAVDGLTDAVAVEVSGGHACAVTASGGVKCWGDNTYGQLGDGTTTSSWSPVEVTGLTVIAAVSSSASSSHVCAVTRSGGVYCWGSGDLGDGQVSQSATPVQVPVLPGVVGWPESVSVTVTDADPTVAPVTVVVPFTLLR